MDKIQYWRASVTSSYSEAFMLITTEISLYTWVRAAAAREKPSISLHPSTHDTCDRTPGILARPLKEAT